MVPSSDAIGVAMSIPSMFPAHGVFARTGQQSLRIPRVRAHSLIASVDRRVRAGPSLSRTESTRAFGGRLRAEDAVRCAILGRLDTEHQHQIYGTDKRRQPPLQAYVPVPGYLHGLCLRSMNRTSPRVCHAA